MYDPNRDPLDIEYNSGFTFQNCFREVDRSCTLTEDANKLFSTIVHTSLKSIIAGSCKLALHRNVDTLGLHDVILYLKTQFNIDPCIENDEGYYYVIETCEEVEPPPPVKKSKQGKPKLIKPPKYVIKTSENSEISIKPKRQPKMKK